MDEELLYNFQLSHSLAHCHHIATAELQISWNPYTLEGFTEAYETFIQYVSEHIYPMRDLLDDSPEFIEFALTYVPVHVEGFNPFEDMFDEFQEASILRPLVALVWVEEYGGSLDAGNAYLELLYRWQIRHPVPIHAIYQWIESKLASEPKPLVEVLINDQPEERPQLTEDEQRLADLALILRYVTANTGSPYLDTTYDDLAENYGEEYWEPDVIENLRAMWADAKPLQERIHRFHDWCANEEANLAWAMGIIRQACDELATEEGRPWTTEEYRQRLLASIDTAEYGLDDDDHGLPGEEEE